MNICLVNNLFPPINTGSSHYTWDLAENLNKHGHKVIIITSNVENRGQTPPHKFKIYRLKKLVLPKYSLWMKFPDFYFTLFPSNIKKFKNIIKKEEIEIIHQCNNIFDMVFISAYVSRKMRIPLICSLTTQIQSVDKFINKLLQIFDLLIVKRFFARFVHKFIALDKETKRFIVERYGDKGHISIIPFSIPSPEQFFAINIDYKNTKYRMISLGHVSTIKDRRETILAWNEVLKKFPKATLRILGDLFSNYSKNLIEKKNLTGYIEFTGRIVHSELPEKIKDGDIGGLLATNIPYHKGVGTANLELMASGLPVIVDADDDFFGPNFPFKSGEHFIKAESRDPEWLANKIIELFENPKMREEIGKNGRDFVLNTLTWERIIPEIENLYEEAIRNNDKK